MSNIARYLADFQRSRQADESVWDRTLRWLFTNSVHAEPESVRVADDEFLIAALRYSTQNSVEVTDEYIDNLTREVREAIEFVEARRQEQRFLPG